MNRHKIQIKGTILEPLRIVQNKLNRSSSSVKALCANKVIRCVKIEGSWYVDPASLVNGLREVQKRRSAKGILISKIRNSEIMASGTNLRGKGMKIIDKIHKKRIS